MNLTKYAPKHYIHIALIADWKRGDPKVLEPQSAEHWAWYDLDDLPRPLFETCERAIRHYRDGDASDYFDS